MYYVGKSFNYSWPEAQTQQLRHGDCTYTCFLSNSKDWSLMHCIIISILRVTKSGPPTTHMHCKYFYYSQIVHFYVIIWCFSTTTLLGIGMVNHLVISCLYNYQSSSVLFICVMVSSCMGEWVSVKNWHYYNICI